MNDMEMLRSQLAEARGQAANWKAKYDRLASVPAEDVHTMANADAHLQHIALCEELVKYGRHLDTCSGHDKCDCGFYDSYTLAWEVIHGEDDSTGTA